jgi:hypothetical protein
MIRLIGPTLGELYYGKQLDWQKITLETRKMTSSTELESKKDE